MTGAIESLRNALRTDNTAFFDAENVGKAMVSAHHYLHQVLLAGNFSEAGNSLNDLSAPHVRRVSPNQEYLE